MVADEWSGDEEGDDGEIDGQYGDLKARCVPGMAVIEQAQLGAEPGKPPGPPAIGVALLVHRGTLSVLDNR